MPNIFGKNNRVIIPLFLFMKKILNNYAFIDSQNLNLGILGLGWKLDFKKFRVYLEEKYAVKKIFLFIGYIPQNQKLYKSLRSYGYLLIFKSIIKENGKIKGNVDAELVLHTMIEYQNFDKAIIVSGDGDFSCLIKYLYREDKLLRLVIPNKYKYSILLKRALPLVRYRVFLNDKKKILSYKIKHRQDKLGDASSGGLH